MNISIRNECNSRNEEIKQKKTKKENKLGTQQLMCNITADRSLILNICCFVRLFCHKNSRNENCGLSLKLVLK